MYPDAILMQCICSLQYIACIKMLYTATQMHVEENSNRRRQNDEKCFGGKSRFEMYATFFTGSKSAIEVACIHTDAFIYIHSRFIYTYKNDESQHRTQKKNKTKMKRGKRKIVITKRPHHYPRQIEWHIQFTWLKMILYFIESTCKQTKILKETAYIIRNAYTHSS